LAEARERVEPPEPRDAVALEEFRALCRPTSRPARFVVAVEHVSEPSQPKGSQRDPKTHTSISQ
jgi:hypothetical protein